MIQSGLLGPDDRVELLEGYLVLNMPRGPEHDFAITALMKRLYRMISDEWVMRGQCAATLRDSEPEPDLAIVRGAESTYRTRHPQPSDVAVLIEVSDSSLSRDRKEKARIYARAKVPVYWVVNIPDRRIEVYTDPSGPTEEPMYQTRTEYPVGSAVPVILDGTQVGTIAVADVIP